MCNGKELTVTAADAAVVRKIWDGPRTPSGKKLWSGVPIGANLAALAGVSDPDANGNVKGAPFQVPADWVRLWVAKDPSLDVSKITYSQFTRLFKQSEAEYDKVIGTDDPDLSAFLKSGGKLLTWHGQADQYIPTQGTVQYRKQVEREMGGPKRVDDFYRLFIAPNTDHCGLNGLDGSADGLAALTAWVEHGKAPKTLPATRRCCAPSCRSRATGRFEAQRHMFSRGLRWLRSRPDARGRPAPRRRSAWSAAPE